MSSKYTIPACFHNYVNFKNSETNSVKMEHRSIYLFWKIIFVVLCSCTCLQCIVKIYIFIFLHCPHLREILEIWLQINEANFQLWLYDYSYFLKSSILILVFYSMTRPKYEDNRWQITILIRTKSYPFCKQFFLAPSYSFNVMMASLQILI